MSDAYRSYLELLETLRDKVEALSELAKKKSRPPETTT